MYFAERYISRRQQRWPHKAAGTHPAIYATNAAATTTDNHATTTTTTNYYSLDSGSHTVTKNTKTVHQIHRVARQHLQQFRKRERDQQCEIESEAEGLESFAGKCNIANKKSSFSSFSMFADCNHFLSAKIASSADD